MLGGKSKRWMDNATNWSALTPEEKVVLRHMRPSRAQMLEILDAPQPSLDAEYVAMIRKMTSVVLHNDFSTSKGAPQSSQAAALLGSTVDEEFPVCEKPWLFCLPPRVESRVTYATRTTVRFSPGKTVHKTVHGLTVVLLDADTVRVNGAVDCKVGGASPCGRVRAVSIGCDGVVVLEVEHAFVVDSRGSVQVDDALVATPPEFLLTYEEEVVVDGVAAWGFSVGGSVLDARQLEVVTRSFQASRPFTTLVRARFDAASPATAAKLAGRHVGCASALELVVAGQAVCLVDWTLKKGYKWTAFNRCVVCVAELEAREALAELEGDDGDETMEEGFAEVKSAARRQQMMLVRCELHMVIPHGRLPEFAPRAHLGSKFVVSAPYRQRICAAFATPAAHAFANAAGKLAEQTWQACKDVARVCGVPADAAALEALPKLGGSAALLDNVFTSACLDERTFAGQCSRIGAIDMIRRKLPSTSCNPLVLSLVAGHCGGVGTIVRVCHDPACPALPAAQRAADLRAALEEAVGSAYRSVAALSKTFKASWDAGRFARAGAVCPEAVLPARNKTTIHEYMKECMTAVSAKGVCHEARAKFNNKEHPLSAVDSARVARDVVGCYRAVQPIVVGGGRPGTVSAESCCAAPSSHFNDIDDAVLMFCMADATCDSLMSVLSLVPGMSVDVGLALAATLDVACDKAEAAVRALVLVKNTFGVTPSRNVKDPSDLLPDWRNIAALLDACAAVAVAMDAVVVQARRLAASLQDRAFGQFKKVLMQFANYGDSHLAATLRLLQKGDEDFPRRGTECPTCCVRLNSVDPAARNRRIGSAPLHCGPYRELPGGKITCVHATHGPQGHVLDRLLACACRGCGQTLAAYGVQQGGTELFCRVCGTTVLTNVYQVDACVSCVRAGRVPEVAYGDDYEEPFFCDGVTKAVTCKTCGAIQAYNALDDSDDVTYSEDAEAGTSNSRAGRANARDLVLRTDVARNGCSTSHMRAFRTTMAEVERGCQPRINKNTTTLHARQQGIDRLRVYVDGFVSDGTICVVAGKLIKDMYARVRLAERVHSDTAVFPLLIVLALLKGRQDALALGRGACRACVFCKVQIPVLKTQDHTLKCAKLFLNRTKEYAACAESASPLAAARTAAEQVIQAHAAQIKRFFVVERQAKARASKLRAQIEVDVMDPVAVSSLFAGGGGGSLRCKKPRMLSP